MKKLLVIIPLLVLVLIGATYLNDNIYHPYQTSIDDSETLSVEAIWVGYEDGFEKNRKFLYMVLETEEGVISFDMRSLIGYSHSPQFELAIGNLVGASYKKSGNSYYLVSIEE